MIVQQYLSFKLEKKNHLISINGKKKFKRITGRRRKAAFKGLHRSVFFAACSVLKHNRASEVFAGFKVHDFEYYGQRT